jgi:sodium-dependent dicarboxylate transporter 2/3/5
MTDASERAPSTLRLLLGVALGVAVGLAAASAGVQPRAAATAGVTTLVATWWITEALPIPVTSIVPFVLLPIVAGVDHRTLALNGYGNPIILLLLGGFMLSRAVERTGLHRRIALMLVRALGRFGARGLVLGFMVATAASSMWISNSATALILLPVAIAVLDAESSERRAVLRVPLLLGIAYAASIGGMGTKIGSPANLAAVASHERLTGHEIGFLEWMGHGLPIVVTLLPLAWLWLCRGIDSHRVRLPADPGPWRPAEVRVAVVFSLTACAWIFRSEPWSGWTGALGLDGVHDDTIALAGALACFLVPDGRGGRLLDWPTASGLPWGLLLLFGGGLALARGFTETGLSESVGNGLGGLLALGPWVVVPLVCLSVTFLTEVTSNTATVVLLAPILGAAALRADPPYDPLVLLLPAAFTASCAFMLPVATAPNAIVFGSGDLTIGRMSREGLPLNLIGVAVVAGWALWRFA